MKNRLILKKKRFFKLTLFGLLLDSDYDLYVERPLSFYREKKAKYENLVSNYRDFCCHDFKVALLGKLKSSLSMLLEEEVQEKLVTHSSDPHIYTKYLRYSLSELSTSGVSEEFFRRADLRDGELEEYNRVLNSEDTSSDLAKRTRRFNNKAQDFKAVRFVEILLGALKEQSSSEEGCFAPIRVQKGIFFFFWQKARSSQDLEKFLSGYLRVRDSALVPFDGKPLSRKAYWDMRKDPAFFQEILRFPERAFLLTQGYNVYEMFLPFMRSYQTAFFEGKPFPDCIEVMCSNFLDIVSKQLKADERKEESSQEETESQEYIFTLEHLLPSEHPLNLYYSWLNAHSELQFSQERRDRFGALCQRDPSLRYLKSTRGKGEKNDYPKKSS